MESKEILAQLQTIENEQQYDINKDDMTATINVFDHDFIVNGLKYVINGTITRQLLSVCSASYELPEEVEYSDKADFEGELGIYDKDGEEIYYDELNIKL